MRSIDNHTNNIIHVSCGLKNQVSLGNTPGLVSLISLDHNHVLAIACGIMMSYYVGLYLHKSYALNHKNVYTELHYQCHIYMFIEGK